MDSCDTGNACYTQEFVLDQGWITRTRRTFDRALQSLPITQHDRIWQLYLVRISCSTSAALCSAGCCLTSTYKLFTQLATCMNLPYLCPRPVELLGSDHISRDQKS